MTTTYRIGSLWAGERSRPIAELFDKLTRTPLDPRFEQHGGDFIDASLLSRSVRFHGNFLRESFNFQVNTDEPETIERLTTAIRANQRRPDYVAEIEYRDAAAREYAAPVAAEG